MMQLVNAIIENPVLFTIPVISAIIGWGTNKVAIDLTFYPLEYKGIKPWLGWQGIIPARSHVMGDRVVQLTVSKLLDIQHEFSKLDPAIVAREMKPGVDILTRKIVNQVAQKEIPLVWFVLPKNVKENVYNSIAGELPSVIQSMMKEIKEEIHSFIDFKQLFLTELLRDKELLNTLFKKCGEKEFLFIERSGLYFGFLLGIPQLILWVYFPIWWILPLFGLVNGYLTNWIAMKMIFEPQKPVNLFLFTLQGLFLKRQKEVSEAYAEIMANEVVSVKKIFEEMLRGSASERFTSLIVKHVSKAVDQSAGVSKNIIHLISGREKFNEIKVIACQVFIEELPQSVSGVLRYAEETIKTKEILTSKIMELTPIEFTGLLRPIFQEDEWKLIALGGVLGAVAGFIQLLFT